MKTNVKSLFRVTIDGSVYEGTYEEIAEQCGYSEVYVRRFRTMPRKGIKVERLTNGKNLFNVWSKDKEKLLYEAMPSKDIAKAISCRQCVISQYEGKIYKEYFIERIE